MDRTIPAWGLFRLFRVLGDKEVTGQLSLSFARGDIALTYKQGYVTDCLTDINALTFKSFLVQSGMVTDPSRAESLQTMEQLVEGRVVRSEDTRRFYNSYVRSVVGRIMAEPVESWSFSPLPSTGPATTVEAVDVCAELFTVVQRHKDVPTMRIVVERLGVHVELTPMLRPECLVHAKAHFRGSQLVADIARGFCPPITFALLEDERNIRILFAFIVTGAIAAKSVNSQPHTFQSVPHYTGRDTLHDVQRDKIDDLPAVHDVPSAYDAPHAREAHVASEVIAAVETPLVFQSSEAHGAPETREPSTNVEEPVFRGGTSQLEDMPADESQPGQSDRTPYDSPMPTESAPAPVRRTAPVIDPRLDHMRDSELDLSLQAELARTARVNHYELLELNPDARLSAVRMAVLRAARKYSRARYEGAVGFATLAGLDKLLVRINTAGDVLADENARIAYNRTQAISTPGLETMLMTIFAARNTWRQGMELLDSRKAAEALELFERAAGQDTEEPDYLCAEGRALLAMAGDDETFDRIDGLIDAAFGFDRDLIEAHMLSALFLSRRNEPEEARVHIRKILLLDAEHQEAKAFKVKPKSAQTQAGRGNFMKKPESLFDRAVKWIGRK